MTELEQNGRPLLCVVHDEAEVRRLLVGDLGRRFGSDYEVQAYPDAASALDALRGHRNDRRPVAAVFTADNDVYGEEAFRVKVHDLHPAARRVALVGRGEWSQTHPAVAAPVATRQVTS